jgi:hypothetical protein
MFTFKIDDFIPPVLSVPDENVFDLSNNGPVLTRLGLIFSVQLRTTNYA